MHTDRDNYTHTRTHRHTEGKTREVDRKTDSHTAQQIDRLIVTERGGQIDRPADRHTEPDRKREGERKRETDRH